MTLMVMPMTNARHSSSTHYFCLREILVQVLEKSLEAAALRSDSGKNAKRCVSDIKAANARMLKLGHRVRNTSEVIFVAIA